MNIRFKETVYADKFKKITRSRNKIFKNYWVENSLLYNKFTFTTDCIGFDDIEQISVGDTVIIFTQYPEKYRDELVRECIELLSKYDSISNIVQSVIGGDK